MKAYVNFVIFCATRGRFGFSVGFFGDGGDSERVVSGQIDECGVRRSGLDGGHRDSRSDRWLYWRFYRFGNNGSGISRSREVGADRVVGFDGGAHFVDDFGMMTVGLERDSVVEASRRIVLEDVWDRVGLGDELFADGGRRDSGAFDGLAFGVDDVGEER